MLNIPSVESHDLNMPQSDFVPLADLIGIIYQIRDDYLNLCSKEYSESKGLYEDLTEGKFSFPIIHSIRSEPSSHRLISILQQKKKDPDLQKLAVASMEHTQSFQYCRDKLAILTLAARKLARDLDQGGSGKDYGIQKILDVLAQLD
jgi:geranylgeranyl diphosphate synthase type 3